jgi:riboflavin synthase
MFTGLIELQAEVTSVIKNTFGHRLMLRPEHPLITVPGESIAVNGVCLTVLADVCETTQLAFDVSPETLRITHIGHLEVGTRVNLERALQATSRMGGHYVTGHVDTTAVLRVIKPVGEFVAWTVGGFTPETLRYLIPKGSIALDGVSLTINQVFSDGIEIMLVPHTLQHTTLGTMVLNQCLNVEFDYIARIVAHQLGSVADSTILPAWLSQSDRKVEVV